MDKNYLSSLFYCAALLCVSNSFLSCNFNGKNEEQSSFNVAFAKSSASFLDSAETLPFLSKIDKDHLQHIYAENAFQPLWVGEEGYTAIADTVLTYLGSCYLDGLFKEDYLYDSLLVRYELGILDSTKQLKQDFWVISDLFFTNALIKLHHDLEVGRLVEDSASTWENAESFHKSFCTSFASFRAEGSFAQNIAAWQPVHADYALLKSAIPPYVKSMDKTTYNTVPFPYKDSIAFVKILYKRLQQSGIGSEKIALPDSAELSLAIKKYQQKKAIKATGVASASLIEMLNDNDLEKFKRIAIALDKYKALPAKMPQQYIWVNLPAFSLKVVDNDTIALSSKIICGKSYTSTPEITSEISDIIIYPTWTVPLSIVQKEMIPGMKRNRTYLARRNMYLIDSKGRKRSPQSINWAKYTSAIPYAVQQASGDNNALGIIKFNFKNKHSVYLHDTNQRYLYDRKNRDLSHGCIRVQEFKKLAHYIADSDSIYTAGTSTSSYTKDSIDTWLARKTNHKIVVNKQIPLYIKYIGCEFVNGEIKFYRDIYNEDATLSAKYLAVNKL